MALKYLWAREKIARLSDYGKAGMNVREDVAYAVSLGLKYSLMTEYTSFIAVDKIIRDTGEVVTVEQPLPLPEGVSDLALPDGMGGFSTEVEPQGKQVVIWGKIRQTTVYQSSRYYPNPFNPETWIPFYLAEPADVVISIYDICGRAVRLCV